MAANDSEDDKPTVVINLDELKKQTQQEKKELEAVTQDLEFATPVKPLSPNGSKDLACILFDLGESFFNTQLTLFPGQAQPLVINDLKLLNAKLKEDSHVCLFLNYHSGPKQVNALCSQLRQKFPQTRIIICVKNLSQEKMLKHQKSASGAHAYLSIPLDSSRIEKVLEELSHQTI